MRVEQKSDRGWRVQSAGVFPFFRYSFSVITCFSQFSFHLNWHCHRHCAIAIASTNQESEHQESKWRRITSTLFFSTIHDRHWGLLGYTRRRCNWLFAPMTTTQQPRRKQIQDLEFTWLQSCNVWHSKVFNRIGFIAPFALRTVSGLCLFDPFLCLVGGTRGAVLVWSILFLLFVCILPSVCDDRSDSVNKGCISCSIGRKGRDDKKAQGWRSGNNWDPVHCPHPFFPNDEIFKGMFDLSPPYPAIQTVSPWCSWIGTEKREDTRVSQW